MGRTFVLFKPLDKSEVDNKIHRILLRFIFQLLVGFKSTSSFCLFVDSVDVECFLNILAETITGKRVYPWSTSVLITVFSAFLNSCMPCENHGFSCFMKKIITGKRVHVLAYSHCFLLVH